MEPWSGRISKHQHGLHFDVSGSLGHSCKAVRHQCCETWGAVVLFSPQPLSTVPWVTGVAPHSLSSWKRMGGTRERVLKINMWVSKCLGRDWGLYTLTQQQRLRLGGSGVCIVLCAKATNRSHFSFLAVGYIIIRIAGNRGGWCEIWSLHYSSFFLTPAVSGEWKLTTGEEEVNLQWVKWVLCIVSSFAVRFGCDRMDDGSVKGGAVGGAVTWQSGTTACQNTESFFSLDFILSSSPSSSPLACPSLYLFSCFETDCLLPSQRHLVLID